MSLILKQIYKDIIKSSNCCEDIEMEVFESIPWSNLTRENKKKYILNYMKDHNIIPEDISMYTFKNISYNKEQRKITNLTYYKKE